ncbi:MAG: HAD family hydrolase [Lactobacillus sp.]|nr:HAD family hydrolase [Lactobacillus sp.]
MYKNIIFDIDGTLLDTHDAALLGLQKSLWEDYHIKQTLADLEFSFSGTAKDVFNKYQIPQDQEYEFAESVMTNSLTFTDEIKPFAGIEETLEQLQARHVPLIVVTSEDQQEVDAVFKKTSISPYFQQFVTADQVQEHKPAAEPTLAALKKLQATPQDTLYIGDSKNDVGSAHNAQVAFGLATWGANPQDSFPEAEYLLQKPQDILQLVP